MTLCEKLNIDYQCLLDTIRCFTPDMIIRRAKEIYIAQRILDSVEELSREDKIDGEVTQRLLEDTEGEGETLEKLVGIVERDDYFDETWWYNFYDALTLGLIRNYPTVKGKGEEALK